MGEVGGATPEMGGVCGEGAGLTRKQGLAGCEWRAELKGKWAWLEGRAVLWEWAGLRRKWEGMSGSGRGQWGSRAGLRRGGGVRSKGAG